MSTPRTRWVGILGLVVGYDVWCARNATEGDTLSEVLRELFDVETRRGQAAFCAAWLLLGSWFVPHIIEKAGDSSSGSS